MWDFAVYARFIHRALLALVCVLLLLSSNDARSESPSGHVTVAAVQFAGRGTVKVDPTCSGSHVNCAIEALIRRAARRGSRIVVTPEYALAQRAPEATPTVGESPSDPARAPLLTRFATLANELDLYLVLNLRTNRNGKLHNTQVAFNPEGTVVGIHHKFELFRGEKRTHTAGDDVSVFETPWGRVGMLICADLYGDARLHDKLTGELGARIIVLSSMWTVSRATRWQAAFAHDWNVYVVAANTTAGPGKGGGVFDRSGQPLAISENGTDGLTIASIPP